MSALVLVLAFIWQCGLVQGQLVSAVPRSISQPVLGYRPRLVASCSADDSVFLRASYGMYDEASLAHAYACYSASNLRKSLQLLARCRQCTEPRFILARIAVNIRLGDDSSAERLLDLAQKNKMDGSWSPDEPPYSVSNPTGGESLLLDRRGVSAFSFFRDYALASVRTEGARSMVAAIVRDASSGRSAFAEKSLQELAENGEVGVAEWLYGCLAFKNGLNEDARRAWADVLFRQDQNSSNASTTLIQWSSIALLLGSIPHEYSK